jgi:hypothetical protein
MLVLAAISPRELPAPTAAGRTRSCRATGRWAGPPGGPEARPEPGSGSEGPHPDAALSEVVHQVGYLAQVAADPVQDVHHDGVAGPGTGQELVQDLRPVRAAVPSRRRRLRLLPGRRWGHGQPPAPRRHRHCGAAGAVLAVVTAILGAAATRPDLASITPAGTADICFTWSMGCPCFVFGVSNTPGNRPACGHGSGNSRFCATRPREAAATGAGRSPGSPAACSRAAGCDRGRTRSRDGDLSSGAGPRLGAGPGRDL